MILKLILNLNYISLELGQTDGLYCVSIRTHKVQFVKCVNALV